MIRTKEDLVFYMKEDARANFMENCSWIKYLLKLFSGSESAHVWRYLKCLRKCEWHYNNIGFYHSLCYNLYKVKLHRLGFKYNIRIPVNVCGYGLTIYHLAGGGGCMVNAERVGNYCELQSGVLLGNSHKSEAEKPNVGDHVTLGPGAKVLGKVNIGNNCFVLSNAVVVDDIPGDSIAGGIPAKVLKQKEI